MWTGIGLPMLLESKTRAPWVRGRVIGLPRSKRKRCSWLRMKTH